MLSEHPICSVSFGPGDAWCWSYHSGDVYEHSYNHLAPDQAAWIAKTEANYGSRFRIFIGAGEATVMIFANGVGVFAVCKRLPLLKHRPKSIRDIGVPHTDWTKR